MEYANGFALPLGTGPGQDNTFFPNRDPSKGCVTQQGHNSNEMENFTCGQASVGPQGLDLRCSYGSPPNAIRTGVPINYNCGEANSNVSMPAGYNGFGWLDPYGSNRTVVAEIKVQWPPNFDSDPSFWGTGTYSGHPNYGDEIDHFEGFGWGQAGNGTDCLNGNACAQTWAKQDATAPTVAVGGGGGGESFNVGPTIGGDPSRAVHTYTVEYTGSTAMAWVDGRQVVYSWPNPGATVLHVGSHSTELQDLILTYAMRGGFVGNGGVMIQDPVPTFNQPGQFHDMYVRSIAIYENASANNAGMQSTNGTVPLIAPGTTIVGGPVTTSSSTSTSSTSSTPTTTSTTPTSTSTTSTTTTSITTSSSSTSSEQDHHHHHRCKYEHCQYELESEHHGLARGPLVRIRRSTGLPVRNGGVAIR